MKRALIALGILVVAAIAISNQRGDDTVSKSIKSSSKSTEAPTKIAEAESCKSDWHLCSDNADLINNFSAYEQGKWKYYCKEAATKMAKYGEPKFPWLFSFSSFYPGDDYVKTGKVVLVEKDAQFQNGFGAMVHSRVICWYDINRNAVDNVVIEAK